MTGTTLFRIRRGLGVSQAAFARLLAIAPNSLARMERDERPVRPPMARLVLLVAHLAEIGDDYAAQLAAKGQGRRPTQKRPARAR